MTYTLKHDYGRYMVFKITSEKPRMIYGSIDGIGSHAKPRDCIGRFVTEDAARAAIARVEAIRREHEHMIDHARRAYSNAVESRDRDIEIYLKGLEQ